MPSPPLRPPPNGFGGPQPLGQPPVLAIEEGAYDAEGASADAVANTDAYEEASADAAVANADAVAAGASANTTILSQGASSNSTSTSTSSSTLRADAADRGLRGDAT